MASETKCELINVNKIMSNTTVDLNYTFFVMKGLIHVYRLIKLNECPSFEKAINQPAPGYDYQPVHPDQGCDKLFQTHTYGQLCFYQKIFAVF